jgi:hypothetical protein
MQPQVENGQMGQRPGDAAVGATLYIEGQVTKSGSRAVTLLLTLVMVTMGLLALFWGGGLVAQGYLYQQPAERLPLRSALAAVLVGLFITLWVWIDQRNPKKYDTFFEFSGESSRPFHEFDAIRWQEKEQVKDKIVARKDDKGQPVERVMKVKQSSGAKGAPFIDEATSKPFQLSGAFPPDNARLMTVALRVKLDDGPPVRFNAVLVKDDKTGAVGYPIGERRFIEENGSRYVRLDELGLMFTPTPGVVFTALLLNFLLFVVWFAALWPVMRFSWGHALGFTAIFGLVTMLLIMPLLFKPNRTPKAPGVEAVWVGDTECRSTFHGEPGA